ncbi:MAG TPA: hypothetical protein VF258_08355, partial [Luteolibacter sp.]
TCSVVQGEEDRKIVEKHRWINNRAVYNVADSKMFERFDKLIINPPAYSPLAGINGLTQPFATLVITKSEEIREAVKADFFRVEVSKQVTHSGVSISEAPFLFNILKGVESFESNSSRSMGYYQTNPLFKDVLSIVEKESKKESAKAKPPQLLPPGGYAKSIVDVSIANQSIYELLQEVTRKDPVAPNVGIENIIAWIDLDVGVRPESSWTRENPVLRVGMTENRALTIFKKYRLKGIDAIEVIEERIGIFEDVELWGKLSDLLTRVNTE